MMIMPVKFRRKVFMSGRSLRVNIPKEVATHLHLQEGDWVEISAPNSKMIVEKAEDQSDE